jgi:hypothetical protein
MCVRYNNNNAQFVKVVYSKAIVNSKVELIPLELYADGTVKRCN